MNHIPEDCDDRGEVDLVEGQDRSDGEVHDEAVEYEPTNDDLHLCAADTPEDGEMAPEEIRGSNSLARYFREVAQHPLLTAEEEKELANAWRNDGDVVARDKLYVANLRLVIYLAKRVYPGHKGCLTLADFIQNGNIGLLKACDRFDPNRGFRFSTYASWWIRCGMTASASKTRRMIYIPMHLEVKNQDLAKHSQVMEVGLGREPTARELAKNLGVPIEKIWAFLTRTRVSAVLHRVNPDTNVALADSLTDEDAIPPDVQIAMSQDQTLVEPLLGMLTSRERVVLEGRFGLGESTDGVGMTLKELGKILELSHEGVRQVEAAALKKLRLCLQIFLPDPEPGMLDVVLADIRERYTVEEWLGLGLPARRSFTSCGMGLSWLNHRLGLEGNGPSEHESFLQLSVRIFGKEAVDGVNNATRKRRGVGKKSRSSAGAGAVTQ